MDVVLTHHLRHSPVERPVPLSQTVAQSRRPTTPLTSCSPAKGACLLMLRKKGVRVAIVLAASSLEIDVLIFTKVDVLK
jgi:hypothetical protein